MPKELTGKPRAMGRKDFQREWLNPAVGTEKMEVKKCSFLAVEVLGRVRSCPSFYGGGG